jgi:hypothetical protein
MHLLFSILVLLQPLVKQLVQKAWPDTRGAHSFGGMGEWVIVVCLWGGPVLQQTAAAAAANGAASAGGWTRCGQLGWKDEQDVQPSAGVPTL